MQTNVFEPPSTDQAYGALRREVAAYIIAETQNGTKEPHVALDTGAAIIEEKLLDNTLPLKIGDILDRYKGGSGVPPSLLPPDVRAHLDDRERGRYVPQERRQQRVAGTAGTAEKPRVIGTLSSRGAITPASLEAVYDDTVLCGALWHSGLLSAVLSALGWREVDQRLRDIETGVLMDLDNRNDPGMAKHTIGSKTNPVLGKPTVSLARRLTGKTAFGVSAAAAAHGDFIAHQRANVVNAAKAVHDGTNAVGYGPSFLEAYIHGINVAAGAEAEMKKEDTAVAKFRVLAYATACALYVIVKHHVAKCAPPKATNKSITTGEQLAAAILDMLSKHTAIPSAKYGSFVMLLRHVNYQLHANVAAYELKDANGTIAQADMVDLVRRLATFESSPDHGFGRLLRPGKPGFGSLFQTYMHTYPDAGHAVNGPQPAANDSVAILRLILAELAADVKPSSDTSTLEELDTTDARADVFSTKLEARVKRMVDSTRLLVDGAKVADPQYLSVVTRARSSVLTANARKPTGKPGELAQNLSDLLDAARNATGSKITMPHLDRDTKEKEIKYSDIVAYVLDSTVPVPENTNASERSGHLDEFARAVSSKSSSSLAKFVLVMRHLTLEMKRTFAATGAAAATGAVDIHAKSSATSVSGTELPALITLGKNGKYFDVKITDMKHVQLIFAAHTAAGTAAAALEKHIYARLPGAFVTIAEEGGNAVLKLDARTSEETRAKLANQKKRVLAFKEDKTTLEAWHNAAETLLGVKQDDMRGRAPADAFRGFGKGTYGVLFKDESVPAVQDCWRLFVHITGERTERDDTRLRAIRASLYLLLKNAYAHIKTINAFTGGVVYGDDEWGSLLVDGATIHGLSKKLAKVGTLGLDDGKGSMFRKAPTLLREKETLHVHRWPDMEFVPAPFAHATPMFWKDPASLP
jgi:hypothetical protein